MGLVRQLSQHKNMLRKDMATFLAMDESLHKTVPVHTKHGTGSIDLKLRVGDVSVKQDVSVRVDGELHMPNWENKRIPIMEAKVTDTNELRLQFLQDKTIEGEPIIENYSLTENEYIALRNQIFGLIHESVDKKDGMSLIRDVASKELEK